jgi:hypothetical protein
MTIGTDAAGHAALIFLTFMTMRTGTDGSAAHQHFAALLRVARLSTGNRSKV